MGTSNSGRLASSNGIFLGLDRRIQKPQGPGWGKSGCGIKGTKATVVASQHVRHPIRDSYQGNQDGIKRTYSLMPMR
jgi:hypothetical protein